MRLRGVMRRQNVPARRTARVTQHVHATLERTARSASHVATDASAIEVLMYIYEPFANVFCA